MLLLLLLGRRWRTKDIVGADAEGTLEVYVQPARVAAVPPKGTSLEAQGTRGRRRRLELEGVVGVGREVDLEGELGAEGVDVEVAGAARVEEAADAVAAEVAGAAAEGVVEEGEVMVGVEGGGGGGGAGGADLVEVEVADLAAVPGAVAEGVAAGAEELGGDEEEVEGVLGVAQMF